MRSRFAAFGRSSTELGKRGLILTFRVCGEPAIAIWRVDMNHHFLPRKSKCVSRNSSIESPLRDERIP
jgi:hypothetical protein